MTNSDTYEPEKKKKQTLLNESNFEFSSTSKLPLCFGLRTDVFSAKFTAKPKTDGAALALINSGTMNQDECVQNQIRSYKKDRS